MLAARHCPDGERTIRAEVRITATLACQKQGGRAVKATNTHRLDLARFVNPALRLTTRLASGFRLHAPRTVPLGGGIGASDQPQRCDGHLATQRPFHLLVDHALQLDGAQRLAAVEGGLAHGVLHRAKGRHSCVQVGSLGKRMVIVRCISIRLLCHIR